MCTLDTARRPARTAGFRKAGIVLTGLAFVACLVPMPVEAAPVGRTLHRTPETTSQAPQTCRPKWPYIVLTCVA